MQKIGPGSNSGSTSSPTVASAHPADVAVWRRGFFATALQVVLLLAWRSAIFLTQVAGLVAIRVECSGAMSTRPRTVNGTDADSRRSSTASNTIVILADIFGRFDLFTGNKHANIAVTKTQYTPQTRLNCRVAPRRRHKRNFREGRGYTYPPLFRVGTVPLLFRHMANITATAPQRTLKI